MNEKAIIRLVRSATLKINYAGHTILIEIGRASCRERVYVLV